MESGITATTDVVVAAGKTFSNPSELAWAIFKVSDNKREIVVAETSKDGTWKDLVEKLKTTTTADGRPEPRYAVFYLRVELPKKDKVASGKRQRALLITYIHEDSPPIPKMVYAASKAALKRAVNASEEISANTNEDLEYDTVLARLWPNENWKEEQN